MRKKAATRSGAKRRVGAKTVEEYLATVPQPARGTLEKVRGWIRAAAPHATEVISYGIPAFKQGKVLVWYAAFARHCSFFPTAEAIQRFKDDVDGYVVSKGTVQFPTDAPLPSSLVKKMVKFRLAQVGKNTG